MKAKIEFINMEVYMRKKYADETYLRGVAQYHIITKELKKQNAYIVLKKINEINKNLIKKSVLIDNGYYVMEYTPLDKLYNARAFIDKDLNAVSYYFDISLGNGVDNGRPYYDDLFLDIVYGTETDNMVRILDEDELLEALESGQITKQDYDLAHRVCNELANEIQENKNIFINTDKKQVIKMLEALELDNRVRKIR